MGDYYIQAPDGTWYVVSPTTGQTSPIANPPPTADPVQVVPYAPPPYEPPPEPEEPPEDEEPPEEPEEEEPEEEEPEEEEEEELEELAEIPIVTGVLAIIIELLNGIGHGFYAAYLSVFDYPIIGAPLSTFFYTASGFFYDLGWSVYDFSVWVLGVSNKIVTFVTGLDLEEWFTSWKSKILDTWDWVVSSWSIIRGNITDWWGSIYPTILEWVQGAKEYALTWILSVKSNLDNLISSWNDFLQAVLPTLPNLISIQDLIMSWFENYAPFWEGWQEVRTQVIEFVNDPLQWFYDRLDSFFERFW